MLNPLPSDEITNLGEALFKRVQWSRGCIVVSPKVLSSQRSPRPPLHGHGSAKSNLKDLVVANVSSSQDGKAKSATVEDKTTKSSRAATTPCQPLENPRVTQNSRWVASISSRRRNPPNYLRVPCWNFMDKGQP